MAPAEAGANADDSIVDMTVFSQLLEIDDDDEEREFSKGLAQQYVEQATTTFAEMDEALASKDLDRLSKLGHFLKGSSASVGLVAVSKHCASMQNLGSCRDAESGTKKISEGDALKEIEALMKDLTAEQGRAKTWLEEFYKEEW